MPGVIYEEISVICAVKQNSELMVKYDTNFVNIVSIKIHCKTTYAMVQFPVFDSFLKKKVLYPALVAAYGTFINFTDARYAILMLAVIKNGSPASAMLQPALELKVRYLQVIVLILSLPDCFVICLQMMVNPALCAPQSGYGVDNHLRADILLIKQTKDYWAPCALDSIVVVSATGFLFISLYWR